MNKTELNYVWKYSHIIRCFGKERLMKYMPVFIIVVILLTAKACIVGDENQKTKTLSNIAIKSKRPQFVPRYSDVCFSSRWRRPKNDSDSYDTFRDAMAFHATRLDWVYSFDPIWIRECKKRGYQFCGTLNTILSDAPDKSTREKGRILNKKGQPVTAPWMRKNGGVWWGCVNSPEYRKSYLAHAKLLIDGGTDLIQMDDPGLNVATIEWGGCYCEYCRKKAEDQGTSLELDMKAFQEASVKEFYTYMRKEIDSYAGYHVPFSSNNYEGESGFPYNLFKCGMAELTEQSGTPDLLYKKLNEALSQDRAQIFTFVSLNVPLTRCIISTAYACGGHIIVPYDVYHEDHPRIFGKPKEYADLYGFVRANADFLDGYENAAVAGKGLKEERYDKELPITVETEGVYAFARARPGEPDAPVVIHVVDWKDVAQPIVLTLRTTCLFGDKPILAKLLVPTPYDRDIHDRAEEHDDFSLLSKKKEVQVETQEDYIKISVPSLYPWGIIVLSPK